MSKYQTRERIVTTDLDGKEHVKYGDPEPIPDPHPNFTAGLNYLLSDEGRALPIEKQREIISELANLVQSLSK